jgi:hypothetical protein
LNIGTILIYARSMSARSRDIQDSEEIMANILEFAPRQRADREPARVASAHAAKSEGHDVIAFAALARLARQWEQLALEGDAENSSRR